MFNPKLMIFFATRLALYSLSIPLLSTLTKLFLTSPLGVRYVSHKSCKMQCIVIRITKNSLGCTSVFYDYYNCARYPPFLGCNISDREMICLIRLKM